MECTSAHRRRSVPKSAVSVQRATPPLMPPRSPGEAERGLVWFGKAEGRCSGVGSAKYAKSNGDPGAIRWAASLPCACEAPLRRERATPSFGDLRAKSRNQ